MATPNYNLPTINPTDRIDGVDAINGLANAVDASLKTVDVEAAAKAPIKHAAADQTYGVGSADLYGHLKLTDKPSEAVDTTQGFAATPKCVADVYEHFTPTVITQRTQTTDITVTKPASLTVAYVALTMATNTERSFGKIYGEIRLTNSASASGVIVIHTGLYLPAPSTAFQMAYTGVEYVTDSSGLTQGIGICSLNVTANGEITITTNTALNDTGKNITIMMNPVALWFRNFGDPIVPSVETYRI